jgi:hypothetical protein
LLLATSGGIRFWRDRQFSTIARESAACPFPLSDFPRTLGSWHAVEGAVSTLDPEVARIAGSSAHIVRKYQDEKSGAVVQVLILYGLANSVFAHSPEVCYPAAGYRPLDAPVDRELSVPTAPAPVHCRSAFFSKSVGGSNRYYEAYYTFLYNGEWLPDVSSRWKSFRYHPGMFKIQLERPVTTLSTETSPTESLLREIAREIDARLSQKMLTASVTTPPKAASPKD